VPVVTPPSADTNPTPPPTGVVVHFRTDWSTGNPLEGGLTRWGGSPVAEVVDAVDKGFPAGMTKVVRVRMGTGSYDWLQAYQKWTLPAVGKSLSFRLYVLNDVSNASVSGNAYASTHPIESSGTAGSISGSYYTVKFGSRADGTYQWALTSPGSGYPKNWVTTTNSIQEEVGNLPKFKVLMFEWKWTRTATSTYSLDMRITGPDGKVVADNNNIGAWGGRPLSNDNKGFVVTEAFMRGMRIGLNGGFGTSRPEYMYYGGWAVCNDWCGAWAPGR